MDVPELSIGQAEIRTYVQGLGHPSIRAYQSWYGLVSDGFAGPITSSHLLEPRCGTPDFVGAEQAQWPRSCMNVTVSYDFDVIDADIAARAWKLALDMWNRVCGINLTLRTDGGRGQIWATDSFIGGSVLAWSYLANDSCNASLEQRYKTNFNYVVDFLAKIIGHEIGHAAGLGHTNRRDDLLYPSIGNRPFRDYPSANDIARMVSRYGEPAPTPEPPTPEPPVPNPPNNGLEIVDGDVLLAIGGKNYPMKLIHSSGV